MKYLFFLSAIILSTLSCNKKDHASSLKDGTYKGTFQRKTNSGGQLSNVTLIFSDGKWTGQSEFTKYPALCSGTFNMLGKDSISFHNECVWTAEFDWTLILDHDYKIKINGRNIELTKEYKDKHTDIYKLTRQ